MAQVYVGTWYKYTNGNLNGAWIDLGKCANYDAFLAKCREAHKGELEPEFMIQDTSDMPDGLDCMEWLSRDDFEAVKIALKEEQQEQEGKPAINIIDYNEKAFAVVGDTRAVKNELKAMGGRFNPKLSCGCGWIFSAKMREKVEQFITSGTVCAAVQNERKKDAGADEGAKYKAMLEEWLQAYPPTDCSEADYYRKSYIGALKIREKYWLLGKPSIETKFCFHDEGPQYEYYKRLCDDEKLLKKHFLAENLDKFDSQLRGMATNKKAYIYNCYRSESGKIDVLTEVPTWWAGENIDRIEECTPEEVSDVRKALKYARDMFEKRLDTYLKRYGVSKLHTWSYWADR